MAAGVVPGMAADSGTGSGEYASPHNPAAWHGSRTNGFSFPCIASILRARSHSQAATGSERSQASKSFCSCPTDDAAPISPIHIFVGSGDISPDALGGFRHPVFNLEIAGPKFSRFSGNHSESVIAPKAVYFPDGRDQVIKVGLHVAEWYRHLPGAVPSFKRLALAVHTFGVSIAPFRKRPPEIVSRYDMLPLDSF